MKQHTSLLLLGVAIAMLTGGCSRKIYVPVERVMVHRDSSRTTALHTDTILRTDSVVIRQSGDTVYHTAWRVRERVSRYVDTVVRVVHDTVATSTTVVATPATTPRPSLMDRLKTHVTTLLSGIFVLLLAALLIKTLWRRFILLR